jgi:hypothetical protein
VDEFVRDRLPLECHPDFHLTHDCNQSRRREVSYLKAGTGS